MRMSAEPALIRSDPGILPDPEAPVRVVRPPELDRRLEPIRGRPDYRQPYGRVPHVGMQTELVEGRRPTALNLPIRDLGVIDTHQEVACGRRGVEAEHSMARLHGGELDISPSLGPMHVDRPLRRPDPIVLLAPGDLAIVTVHHFVVPLNAREV